MVILFSLLVVAIPVWHQVTPHIEDRFASVRTAKGQIATLSTAVVMFKWDNGFYVNGLNDLAVRPTNAPTSWHKYLDHFPLDPWGHPFLYVFPGQHNTNSFDLSSAGPDGKFGTSDDIVNW